MNAAELFLAGELEDAVRVLSAELRNHPADPQGRPFLVELLCFAGDYDGQESPILEVRELRFRIADAHAA